MFNWFKKKAIPSGKHYGWIPQKPDTRDRRLTFMVEELPPSIDLRNKCPAVVDQGDLGSCTANAISGAYEFEYLKQSLGLKDFVPSRLFIYYNERKIEHTVNEDAGAEIRDGIKSVGNGSKGSGVCSETEWPYIISKFTKKPSCKCYKDAKKDQALKYSSLGQTPTQLKSCLSEGFPFVFGFTVYSSFEDIGSDGIMPMPKQGEQVLGGHAVCAVGYDDAKQVYVVRNSWGDSWGDKGYFYMPYKYMHDTDLCSDFWCIQLVE